MADICTTEPFQNFIKTDHTYINIDHNFSKTFRSWDLAVASHFIMSSKSPKVTVAWERGTSDTTNDTIDSTEMDLKNVFTREQATSIYRDERRQSTFSDSTAEWYCFNRRMNKQETVGRIALFLIFSSMIAYMIYLSVRYFDPDINRKTYTKQTTVDEMPAPYIYFSFDTSAYPGNFSCNYELFDKYNLILESFTYASTYNTTVIDYLMWLDDFDDIGNMKMSVILDLDRWVVVHRFHENAAKVEILVIPPSDYKLDVSNAETYYESITDSDKVLNDIGIRLYGVCGFYTPNVTNTTDLYENEEVITDAIYSTILGYNIDHLDQLRNNFNDHSINDTFNTLSYTYEFIVGGYMVVFDYAWFTFKNTINPNSKQEDNDYFVTDVGSTFDMINVKYNAYLELGYYDAFFFIFQPNTAGIKVTYHTDLEDSWTDVLSDIGGMYGVVSGFINFILIYLVWGVKFKNYYFPGQCRNVSAFCNYVVCCVVSTEFVKKKMMFCICFANAYHRIGW